VGGVLRQAIVTDQPDVSMNFDAEMRDGCKEFDVYREMRAPFWNQVLEDVFPVKPYMTYVVRC
jgi:hypothetical protein